MGDYYHSIPLETERERERENLVQHRRGKPTQQAIRKYNVPYFRELIWTLEDRARQMMMALDVLHKLTSFRKRFIVSPAGVGPMPNRVSPATIQENLGNPAHIYEPGIKWKWET